MCSGCQPGALRAAEVTRRSALNLHYLGQEPVSLEGAITGDHYHFSQTQPVQPVDTKDAVFLLASQLFRLAR